MPATMREVAAAADPATRTFLVKADLGPAPTCGSARPPRVTIDDAAASPASIKLPLSALLEDQGGSAVWVRRPATMTVSAQPVRVAGAEGNEVVIAAGLAPGDRGRDRRRARADAGPEGAALRRAEAPLAALGAGAAGARRARLPAPVSADAARDAPCAADADAPTVALQHLALGAGAPALTRYLLVVLLVLGFAAYFQLGQDEDPPFTFRAMVVQASSGPARPRSRWPSR